MPWDHQETTFTEKQTKSCTDADSTFAGYKERIKSVLGSSVFPVYKVGSGETYELKVTEGKAIFLDEAYVGPDVDVADVDCDLRVIVDGESHVVGSLNCQWKRSDELALTLDRNFKIAHNLNDTVHFNAMIGSAHRSYVYEESDSESYEVYDEEIKPGFVSLCDCDHHKEKVHESLHKEND